MSRIVILTLSEQRDGFVDESIAKHLREAGHEALVRPFAMAGMDSITSEKPDIVVLPMIGSEHKLWVARRCHEWGIGVVVRRGEPGATRDVLDSMHEDRQKVVVGNFDYEPYVDLELTWGKEFTEIIGQRKGMPSKKLEACGAFTMDACFAYPRVPHVGQKRILFASGFSGADDDPRYTECGAPTDSSIQTDMYRRHREARDTWIAAINNLVSTKSNKYTFTLKVRPGERPVEYAEKLAGSVKILPYDYPSAKAISECDVVVHSGSTMAIEAHLYGIPTLNFCNVNPDGMVARLAPQVTDFTELSEELGRLLYGQSNIDETRYQVLLERLYDRIDGKASLRAARAIGKLAKSLRRKTDIPDRWPKEVICSHPEVSLQEAADHHKMLCPFCQSDFWLSYEATWGFCPYCAITIRKLFVEAMAGR